MTRSILAKSTFIFTIILSPSNAIYVCTNEFGMYSVIASLFYFASINPVVMIASNYVVGIIASSRNLYAYFVLQFAHIMDFMVLSLFLFKKTILYIDIFISIFSFCWRWLVRETWSWSCCIYLCSAAIPFSPNLLMPCFKLYVCINPQAWKYSIPDRSVFMRGIIIKMICADCELYYSTCSDLASKCCHLCDGTIALLVQRLPWLYYHSPSLLYASKDMSSSYYGL